MQTDRTEIRPWYREPWPWVAIAIPAAAVAMGIITLVLAISNPDPVIVDDRSYDEINSALKAQPAPSPGAKEQEDEGDSSDGAN